MLRVLIVVPARRYSLRLSDKMLRRLGGKELVLWSYESALSCARAIDTGLEGYPSLEGYSSVEVIVACDDESILRCVEGAGGRAIMTSSDLASGSDRVWSALRALEEGSRDDFRYDIVINYQGDLPRCPPNILRDGLAALRASGADIATPIVSISESVAKRASVVKAIFASPSHDHPAREHEDGVVWHRAMLFTRAFAPFSADGDNGDKAPNEYHQHIGIYIYQREALERFIRFPPSRLEQREQLEQLRALENGLTIAVFPIASAPIEINLGSDLASFEQELSLRGQ